LFLVLAAGVWTESFFSGKMLATANDAMKAEIQGHFADLPSMKASFGDTVRRVLRGAEALLLLAQGTDLAMAA
jgi:hypothetical protein